MITAKKAGIYILDVVMSVNFTGELWKPLATIPAAHRPVGRAVKAVVQGSGSNFGWLEVGTDGIIYGFFHADDTQISGQAVWVLTA